MDTEKANALVEHTKVVRVVAKAGLIARLMNEISELAGSRNPLATDWRISS